ncbi:MAG: hypothetical protein AVDCRST_MAG93-9991 [uncultured Chloroflexia bacterium]|uniref:Transposase n=1 Tax=uncultured Chloroflexia bacterium TaxID=1672391 RepID=A0A6J4NTB7_9CHLR|nr:MAG: hypothetical protein AVDCRST_MAG93-9991 [uncultured Chloroflexia bacterium]
MTHKRNIEGLRQHARQRHQETVRRTEDGIQRLIRENRPVNFKAVAETAGVSTAWLYQQPRIKQRIQQLRAQRMSETMVDAKVRASDASKDAMITTLRQRVKQVEAENRDLRKQLEVVYGELYVLTSNHS